MSNEPAGCGSAGSVEAQSARDANARHNALQFAMAFARDGCAPEYVVGAAELFLTFLLGKDSDA